jgi:hypothetical protein
VTGVFVLPGDPAVSFRPNPLDFRSFSFVSGPLEGTYEYAGFGPGHATLDLDWSKSNRRGGKLVRFPAYVGDVVRLTFDVTNVGPRGVPASHASLVVFLPKAVGKGARVRSKDNASCARSTTRTRVVFRCRLGALGPGSNEASVVLDVTARQALAGKTVLAVARISTGSELEPPLDVVERPQGGARLPFKVRKGRPPPGSGGGGGGGGEEPPPEPPSIGVPGATVCLGNFVMETFTGAHVGVFLHRFVQESAYVYACVWKSVEDSQGSDWFVARLDLTPPGLPGTAGDCNKVKDDDRSSSPAFLYSEERYLTVSGGTRMSGAHAVGGDVPVLEEALSRAEDDLVGAACP